MTFDDIISFIISIAQQIYDFISQIIDALIQALNAIFQAIAKIIGDVVQFLQDFPSNLKDFLDDLWNEVIVPAIEKIQEIYDDIQTWLENTLDSVIEFIQTIHDWIMKYIYPWIKRAEEAISIVRAMLSALRILGVKWAAKLDADLAKIQAYLTQGFQDIIGPLNSALTWLKFMTDPAGILSRSFHSVSLFGNLLGVRNAVSFGGDRYLSASEASNTDGDRAMIAGGGNVLTRNQDGSVTFSDASKRVNDGLDSAWDYYGGPKR